MLAFLNSQKTRCKRVRAYLIQSAQEVPTLSLEAVASSIFCNFARAPQRPIRSPIDGDSHWHCPGATWSNMVRYGAIGQGSLVLVASKAPITCGETSAVSMKEIGSVTV